MGLISNGTTIFDNGAMTSGAGSMTLVSSATASSSASIEFSLGSYKEYKFFFVNIHPATNSAKFTCNASIDNGSNYNVVKTTTYWTAYHAENDIAAAMQYNALEDVAQSTGYFNISTNVANQNDSCIGGYFHLFNPSSTTYVKHFIGRMSVDNNYYSQDEYVAGYFNDTNDLTNISFKFTSGNIDDGKILMFGIN